MLVNKTVEFFLSEVAGWGWRSAVSGSGLGQDAGGSRGLGRDKMPAGKSPGRQRARSGQGPDGMPARTEAWAETRCRRPNHMGR